MRRYSPLAFDHPPATFQKENTILTDGGSFCDYPQVLLFAPSHIARKGECEGGTFDGFPHSRSITRPQATDFAQQNRPLQKENTILTDGVSFCDCPQVLLFVRLAYRKSKKRNEARLATGIPRMAEPFAGALPDLLIQRASRRSRQQVQACPRHSKKKTPS